MFVNVNVKYNVLFGIYNGWIKFNILCIKSGLENINIIVSNMLIDFIDFIYFWCLLFWMLLGIFDVDGFRYCFLRLWIVK